jgi:CheY-like chemotaxis protein
MNDLSGVRVLVVEDEGAIALLLEDMLETLGCVVVASVGRLEQAQNEARRVAVDVALLDVNIVGGPVFPVVPTLIERGIPFAFSTGYGAAGIPAHLADRPVLGKPYAMKDLERTLRVAIGT